MFFFFYKSKTQNSFYDLINILTSGIRIIWILYSFLEAVILSGCFIMFVKSNLKFLWEW